MENSSNISNTVAALKGIPTKEELLALLLTEPIEVTFLKLDGDERIMTCTLISNYLPEANREDKLSQTKIRNIEDKVIIAWDINANAWRSFRYDRIKKVVRIMPLPSL